MAGGGLPIASGRGPAPFRVSSLRPIRSRSGADDLRHSARALLMHLYYATHDGHTRRIAVRISERLADAGVAAEPFDLGAAQADTATLANEPLVVAVMAVRYGRHLPQAEQLIASYRALAKPPPLVLASVNLTARKPGKDTAQGSAYLRKLIARNKLSPALATAFAGKLDYPRYGFFDRQIIRFIMLLTGGPTDRNAVVEYTSWPAVDAFADEIAKLCGTTKPSV
jgi:menaquinone-dependent protoporphyrinogen oxidase